MRVVKVSPLKRFVTLIPESSLDLLNIYLVLEAGDLLYVLTSRELKKERKSGSVDSERVLLEVGVELLEKRLNPLSRRVDLHGIIRYESRDLGLVGKHHTIHLGVDDEITVESKRRYQKLEAMAKYFRGLEAGKQLCMVLIDDESVKAYLLTSKGLSILVQKTVEGGKEDPEDRAKALQKMYGEVAEKLESVREEIHVYGPSVIVDEFLKFLTKRSKQLAERVKKTGYVSDTSEAGVSELLRNKALHGLRESIKAIADAEDVEILVEVLATDPTRAGVGLKECLAAVRMKACEKLLMTEDFLWNSLETDEVGELMTGAEQTGVEVRVISSGSEASEKLQSLGGVACLLRYSVDPSVLRLAN